MVLICDSKPKGDIKKSGYYRLVGNVEIARVFRQIHSTVIKNGNELEKLIYDHAAINNAMENVPLLKALKQKNAFVVKCKINKEFTGNKKGIHLDALLIKKDKLFAIEIKDGENFDTKKSSGEVHKLKKAAEIIERLDFFDRPCEPIIVLWNCDDLETSSFKDKEGQRMLMRGKEFSKMIDLDYENFNQIRKHDRHANEEYILNCMENILKAEGRI